MALHKAGTQNGLCLWHWLRLYRYRLMLINDLASVKAGQFFWSKIFPPRSSPILSTPSPTPLLPYPHLILPYPHLILPGRNAVPSAPAGLPSGRNAPGRNAPGRNTIRQEYHPAGACQTPCPLGFARIRSKSTPSEPESKPSYGRNTDPYRGPGRNSEDTVS